MNDLRVGIKSISVPKTVKAGSTILFQGEIPRRGYYLAEGFIKMYTISSTGEENVVFIGAAGSILPISWLMDNADVALFNYEAFTECRLYSFSKDDYQKLIEDNPQYYKPLMQQTSRAFSAALLHTNALEQTHAEDKIAHTLFYLVFQYGEKVNDTTYELSFQLGHKTLASLVGLTRESTTKVMLRLKRLGIVSYDRTNLTINRPRLERHIGEDTIVSFDDSM